MAKQPQQTITSRLTLALAKAHAGVSIAQSLTDKPGKLCDVLADLKTTLETADAEVAAIRKALREIG